MKRHLRARLVAALVLSGITGADVFAQCGPTISVQPKIIMEEQLETRYRLVYETSYEQKEIVSQRPILRTRMEKRTVAVTKPVVETSTVSETYTVRTPVRKQEIIDRSYYKTDYVTETSQREEVYTTLRPVVETQYQTQQMVVQRPVTETQYQTQQSIAYAPVTTYQTQTVDAGQYVAQQYYAPGSSRYRLGFLPGGNAVDTATGMPFYHRAQFGWVPQQSPGVAYTATYYQPNPQQVVVPQTSYMPQVQQHQVPIQVTRMESEVVQQQVPVNVTKMQPTEERRMVPYQTQKPVTQYIELKEPVERIEYVETQMVRPKTVQRTSYKTENVEQEYQVSYYEMEEVRTPIRVTTKVPRYVAETVRRMVPRTVYSPVTLNYYDPYSSAISQGYSSFAPVIETTSTIAPAAACSPSDIPVIDSTDVGASDSKPTTGDADVTPSLQQVQKVEVGDLPAKKPNFSNGSAAGGTPSSATPGDNGQSNGNGGSGTLQPTSGSSSGGLELNSSAGDSTPKT